MVPGTWETESSETLREPEGLLKQVAAAIPKAYNGYKIYCRSIGYLAAFGEKSAAVDSVKDGETKVERTIAALPPDAAFALIGFSQGAWIAGNITQEIGLETLDIGGREFIGYFGLSDPKRNHDDRVGGKIAGSGILGSRGMWGSVSDKVHQFAIRGDVITATEREHSILPELAPYVVKFWIGRPDQWIAYAIAKYNMDRGLFNKVREQFPGIRGFFEFRRRAGLSLDAVAFYIRTGVHGHYPNFEVKPGVKVPAYIANTIREELDRL